MQTNRPFLQKTLLVLCMVFTAPFTKCSAQQSAKELKAQISKIEQLVEKADHGVDAVTDFNGKKEFWSIDDLDSNTRSFYIWSYEQEILYTELFIEKNGMLDFAVEAEKGMPLNHYSDHSWQCVYFLKKGKVIDYTSLGHGKTEDDQWEPEGIITQFRKRKAQLEKIQK